MLWVVIAGKKWSMHMAERKTRGKAKIGRWQRIAAMDEEILDVEGAAALLGVSSRNHL
jgi:hypothetical protein